MYAKIFASMYEGTLVSKGPWQALVTFQQFLVLADRSGIVDMTREAISRFTTIPPKIINAGIEALEAPDPGSRTPSEDGRRIVRLSDNRDWGWQITNYFAYRAIRSAEERAEYMRQYQRDRYQKRKILNNSKHSNRSNPNQPISDADADADADADSDSKSKSRTSALPPDFTLTESMQEFAKTKNLDPVETFEAFRDYWLGCGKPKKDWEAVWRNWCRRQPQFNPPGVSRETKLKLSAVERVRLAGLEHLRKHGEEPL